MFFPREKKERTRKLIERAEDIRDHLYLNQNRYGHWAAIIVFIIASVGFLLAWIYKPENSFLLIGVALFFLLLCISLLSKYLESVKGLIALLFVGIAPYAYYITNVAMNFTNEYLLKKELQFPNIVIYLLFILVCGFLWMFACLIAFEAPAKLANSIVGTILAILTGAINLILLFQNETLGIPVDIANLFVKELGYMPRTLVQIGANMVLFPLLFNVSITKLVFEAREYFDEIDN